MPKISVGILGATGMVGQTLIQLLGDHPWFKVTELAASDKSAGSRYEDIMGTRWNISSDIPEYAKDMEIKTCEPKLDCDIVLSALDSSVAGPVEEQFAKAGYAVSSNAKNHRMDQDVPLLIPEINPDHVDLIGEQRKRRGWEGFIVTDPNCSTIHLALALKPLYDRFGLEKVMVTTMQALSGAGYPGVSSMDITDNVIPFINDEEDKVEIEPVKILGKAINGKIKYADIGISAQCNRVAVKYGHTECASVKLGKKATKEDLIRAFEEFRPNKQLKLPSAPQRPVVYIDKENRPQPKLDVNTQNGMASTVGRLRPCKILDYKFVVLGHNLVRGAAGAAILNAELLKVKGYIS
ncbi:MAG: aspartate-semialdehyde dehydrogenase [Candidatus Micrarchaeota archaeon]|nr:aspartate-semialdehyde dehydrogenase [Candidatus Micrarchaeota archaeon]MDE1833964.1 aspartate-semialdehyde dehydrogenase [Candidatus Micrarchaeota archaeon]MDE1859835.1 aspartate-semialdehyde dehydrogenase [Candidatus Micrarchaeota archaeon]